VPEFEAQKEENAKAQRRKEEKDEILLCALAPLVRQVKPGQSSRMKGVCHVNCSYDM
jgi:hypothetical protein